MKEGDHCSGLLLLSLFTENGTLKLPSSFRRFLIIGTYLLEFGDLDCQVVVTLDSEHGHAVTWAVSTYTPTM